jgi:hypothetical protein
MNNTLIVTGISLLLTLLSVAGIIASSVMAKEKPLDQVICNPTVDGPYVKCCQTFIDDKDNLTVYCTVCDNTTPPSNCGERFPSGGAIEGGNNEDIAAPPTEGISDDPQAGDDKSPDIPSTGGVVDETINDDNSGSENENADTPTNTIPRKGDSGMDTSNLNDNPIVK